MTHLMRRLSAAAPSQRALVPERKYLGRRHSADSSTSSALNLFSLLSSLDPRDKWDALKTGAIHRRMATLEGKGSSSKTNREELEQFLLWQLIRTADTADIAASIDRQIEHREGPWYERLCKDARELYAGLADTEPREAARMISVMDADARKALEIDPSSGIRDLAAALAEKSGAPPLNLARMLAIRAMVHAETGIFNAYSGGRLIAQFAGTEISGLAGSFACFVDAARQLAEHPHFSGVVDVWKGVRTTAFHLKELQALTSGTSKPVKTGFFTSASADPGMSYDSRPRYDTRIKFSGVRSVDVSLFCPWKTRAEQERLILPDQWLRYTDEGLDERGIRCIAASGVAAVDKKDASPFAAAASSAPRTADTTPPDKS